MTAVVSLAKPKPVPDQRLETFRQRWDDNLRKQLTALRDTNRALTIENVALHREITELQRRAEEVCVLLARIDGLEVAAEDRVPYPMGANSSLTGTLPRKILRILIGEDR